MIDVEVFDRTKAIQLTLGYIGINEVRVVDKNIYMRDINIVESRILLLNEVIAEVLDEDDAALYLRISYGKLNRRLNHLDERSEWRNDADGIVRDGNNETIEEIINDVRLLISSMILNVSSLLYVKSTSIVLDKYIPLCSLLIVRARDNGIEVSVTSAINDIAVYLMMLMCKHNI